MPLYTISMVLIMEYFFQWGFESPSPCVRIYGRYMHLIYSSFICDPTFSSLWSTRQSLGCYGWSSALLSAPDEWQIYRNLTMMLIDDVYGHLLARSRHWASSNAFPAWVNRVSAVPSALSPFHIYQIPVFSLHQFHQAFCKENNTFIFVLQTVKLA